MVLHATLPANSVSAPTNAPILRSLVKR